MTAGVLVNEVHVNAAGSAWGREWWTAYRFRHDARVEAVTPTTLAGDVAWVPCDSIEDARWLRDHMIERGIPRTAVRASAHKPRTVFEAACPHPDCRAFIKVGVFRATGIYPCICKAVSVRLTWSGRGVNRAPVLALADRAVS